MRVDLDTFCKLEGLELKPTRAVFLALGQRVGEKAKYSTGDLANWVAEAAGKKRVGRPKKGAGEATQPAVG